MHGGSVSSTSSGRYGFSGSGAGAPVRRCRCSHARNASSSSPVAPIAPSGSCAIIRAATAPPHRPRWSCRNARSALRHSATLVRPVMLDRVRLLEREEVRELQLHRQAVRPLALRVDAERAVEAGNVGHLVGHLEQVLRRVGRLVRRAHLRRRHREDGRVRALDRLVRGRGDSFAQLPDGELGSPAKRHRRLAGRGRQLAQGGELLPCRVRAGERQESVHHSAAQREFIACGLRRHRGLLHIVFQ